MSDDLAAWAKRRQARRRESLATLETVFGGRPPGYALQWAEDRIKAHRDALAAVERSEGDAG